MHRREPWEVALDLPGRIVTLPLTGLGLVVKSTLVDIERRNWADRTRGSMSSSSLPRFGVSFGSSHLGPGTGVGGAIQLHPPGLRNALLLDLEGSTRKYSRTAVELDHGPASVRFTYDWRPQDLWFGSGIGASEDSASSFAWRQQSFRLGLAYPWQPPSDGGEPELAASVWLGPREAILRRGRLAPSFDTEFAGLAGVVNTRQEHFLYGIGLATDRRSGVPHWGRGYRAAVQVERFDRSIAAFTIRDAHTDAPRFTKISVEAEGAISFMRDPRTLRLAVRLVDIGPVEGGAPILFPDLSSLGGEAGLASYDLGRFRDRDLVYSKVTYLFPVFQQVELELHAETGGVYPHLSGARLSTFKSSYGFSFRGHADTTPFAALGADWGTEGFFVKYSFGSIE